MLKPILKYTGGKQKEYPIIKENLPPTIENYYEPFFGGGAIALNLFNDNLVKGKYHINDKSETLMQFYKEIGNEELYKELEYISIEWDKIHILANRISGILADDFVGKVLRELPFEKTCGFDMDLLDCFNECGFFDGDLFNLIVSEITNKYKAFIAKYKKGLIKEEEINHDLGVDCIETAIHQAYYFYIRNKYNEWLTNNNANYTLSERIAQWYFVREYCFCGMHRFGKDGRFNVPYGGKSYNKKSFYKKVELLKDPKLIEFFKEKSIITIGDFEEVLKDVKENDFVFLDPPYDSTFSKYDNNCFSLDDQKRLKECLSKLPCKWMLVIKKTDFISDLYKDFNITEYGKKYMYQARGEYDKDVTHLLIRNYN